MTTPSLPASPELPESVRQETTPGFAEWYAKLPDENRAVIETKHLKILLIEAWSMGAHKVAMSAPLWPSADGRKSDRTPIEQAFDAMAAQRGATPSPLAGLPTPDVPEGEFGADVESIIADTKRMLLETTYRYGAPDSAVMLSLATQVLLLRKALAAARAEVERLKGEQGLLNDKLGIVDLCQIEPLLTDLRAQLATAKEEMTRTQTACSQIAAQRDRAEESLVNVRSDLAKANAAAEAERLELGRVHGDIGLFAKKHLGISDNLPTAETFERMAREIHRIRETSSARLDSCIESDDLLHRMWKAYGNPDSEISREVKNYMDMNEWPDDERIAWHRRKLAQLAAQQSVPVPPEARAVKFAIRERKGHVAYGPDAIECSICPCDENGHNLGNAMAIVSLGGEGGTDASPEAVRAFANLIVDSLNQRTCFPPGEENLSAGASKWLQDVISLADATLKHLEPSCQAAVDIRMARDRLSLSLAAPARPTAAREDTDAANALERLHRIIDSAGVEKLMRGVELGQISWYHKANDAMKHAEAVLAARCANKGKEEKP